MTDDSLPITRCATRLATVFTGTTRVILEAPTGSGKSTVAPQILLDSGAAGSRRVVVLQPRRIAARLLAARVASLRGGVPGGEVGYITRFERRIGSGTRLVFVTEGILLRQMMADPRLEDVGAVVFDEFHERHVYSDVCLAWARRLQQSSRKDLRLVVMSATLDASALAAWLAPCERVKVEGRAHPVDVVHLGKAPARDEAVWDLAARHLAPAFAETDGSALVFMPGAYEIQRTIGAVRERLPSGVPVLPLHGELPPEQQDAAVASGGPRRVIVATNVAETSLTIDGVTLVVDCGLARIARHDPHRGINTLLVEKISRAAADQRAGRAGRTAPGRALRLWTQTDHAVRPAHDTPEIGRVDLSEVFLALAGCGVEDFRAFPWFEAPGETALTHAMELLEDLGAWRDGRLTETGRRMLAFAVHPRYARMFVEAERLGCPGTAAVLAALVQGRGILTRGDGREVAQLREDLLETGATSDFEVHARAWRYAVKSGFDMGRCRRLGIHVQAARQADRAVEQFRAVLGLNENADAAPSEGSLERCLLAAFADHVAARLDEGTLRCELTRGRRATLARESVARGSALLVAGEIREIDGRDGVTTLLSMATAIDFELLAEVFPEDVRTVRTAELDPQLKRVTAREDVFFRDLRVKRGRPAEPTQEEAANILAAEVEANRARLDKWDEDVEHFIRRVNRLSEWMPELHIPPIGSAERRAIAALACHGARTLRDLREREIRPILNDWLGGEHRQALENCAPERLTLPGGRRVRVMYPAQGPPRIAARIQDLYGVTRAPTLARGRVPVAVELLAPNMRAVQVTEDLEGFWRDQYPRLKEQLKRRYPKHEWR